MKTNNCKTNKFSNKINNINKLKDKIRPYLKIKILGKIFKNKFKYD